MPLIDRRLVTAATPAAILIRKEILPVSFMTMSERPLYAASPAPAAGTRLAVISTPRTGNTWLRHLLGRVYAASELPVHNPADLDWSGLPADFILQIHWHRTPAFLSMLEKHRFRVVVLARHPLDVLVSILHFSLHDASTQRWLEGEHGSEAPICGAMPCSSPFMQYATSRRAAALLSVSRQWWDLPGAYRVRYERLVADPLGELTRLVAEIGLPPRQSLAEAVAANAFPTLRKLCGTIQVPEYNHHYWQGTPDNWKRLLPADLALTIAAYHAELFSALQYECDPDPKLDRAQADAAWIRLTRHDLNERLWSYVPTKEKLAQALHKQWLLQERCTQLEAVLDERVELLADAQQSIRRLTSSLARAAAAMKRLFWSQT
jgi:hypothetical protein